MGKGDERMKNKKIFKGTSKPKTVYDRRVIKWGNSRVVALGRIIPSNWLFVRVRIIEKTENSITLKFDVLAKEEIEHA